LGQEDQSGGDGQASCFHFILNPRCFPDYIEGPNGLMPGPSKAVVLHITGCTGGESSVAVNKEMKHSWTAEQGSRTRHIKARRFISCIDQIA
jgi:hypothetical protein